MYALQITLVTCLLNSYYVVINLICVSSRSFLLAASISSLSSSLSHLSSVTLPQVCFASLFLPLLATLFLFLVTFVLSLFLSLCSSRSSDCGPILILYDTHVSRSRHLISTAVHFLTAARPF